MKLDIFPLYAFGYAVWIVAALLLARFVPALRCVGIAAVILYTPVFVLVVGLCNVAGQER